MSSKILLSSHQPVYIPWLGFFHKLAASDLFVVLDNVPYTRHLYYNRNTINSKTGPVLLTVPVHFTNNEVQFHNKVRISDNRKLAKKHWNSISQAYSKSPFFNNYSEELFEIYHSDWSLLIDLNMRLMKFFMNHLGINTKIIMASDYNFVGKKSNLILDIASKLKANAFIFGKLGRDYVDIDSFINSKISPIFQDYIHPEYSQYKSKNFESYLSILDLLFFHGPKSNSILLSGNKTRSEYLEEAELIMKGIISP